MTKRINLSTVLIVGAMLVGAPRYVGLFANSEGVRITGAVWEWVVALSGVGMALLEGVSTWFMWNAWTKAQDGRVRDVLAAFMVASGLTLLWMVAPYIQAGSYGLRVSQVLDAPAMWVWSVSNGLAPLLVMAGVGLAEHLRANVTQPAAQQAVDARALRAMVRDELAQSERKQPTQAVQVNVNTAQVPVAREVAAEVVDVAPVVAQLASGSGWDEAIQRLNARNEPVTATALAREARKSVSAASRFLNSKVKAVTR